jgi:acetylornithine deacetylase/succinyl-diaminopimelate desuccinylase-like protein
MLDRVISSLDSRQDQIIRSLCELLRIPSVSTNPQHKPDMARCAAWIAEGLTRAGLVADVRATRGHPLVLARTPSKPGRPTVLFYGHYDVQPPDPLDQWITPPFEPTIREGSIHARGASDDKGQVWAHIEAITAWQQAGGLPVNLVMLIEGEEEIGSPNLGEFVDGHRDELKADIAVISDTNQFAEGIPAITYGLRGLVYMEVTISGPSHDLHSGLYGGAVPNPANVLAEVLASLHDTSGRVCIDGFNDDVLPLDAREAEMWARLPSSDNELMAELGLKGLTGEKGFTSLQRRWARPTCDINGLTSGYQGPGAKTIIPSTASAKVSMRLVPNQDPAMIAAAFERAIRARCPASVTVKIENHGLAGAVLVPMDSPAMRLAAEAVQVGFGAAPTLIRGGGSIPVVSLFKSKLGVDTLLVGFSLPDDRVHSPNEKFAISGLMGGARTAAALYEKLARLGR